MHKKECKKRAAELRDETLFKQPPPNEECPICLLPLPLEGEKYNFQACCGKELCRGCCYAVEQASGSRVCPFCRTPGHNSDEEYIARLKERVEANDAKAMCNLGFYYADGRMGLPQDCNKAMEILLRAGELGDAMAYCKIGIIYFIGQGVEKDTKKAKHYYELAAMEGDIMSRQGLACIEYDAGNVARALKHFMIAAGAGYDNSLNTIQEFFMNGLATKDDFEKALRAHKDAADEMKSDQRDAADAAHGHN